MIKYIKGDATTPQGAGKKIIVHCCNDIGAWGAGFVLALSRRWPHVRDHYLALESYSLGDVQFVKAQADITVANIIGQHGISAESSFLDAKPFDPDNMALLTKLRQTNRNMRGYRQAVHVPPIRYEAIRQGLRVVHYYATLGPQAGATIHMPRIGCGLAGGRWEEMGPIVEQTLKGLEVTVYDF